MKFNIFRNPFIENYIKGYMDGYTDAEEEFMHTPEDIDIAYWQGYNNAIVEMSSNDDNDPDVDERRQ